MTASGMASPHYASDSDWRLPILIQLLFIVVPLQGLFVYVGDTQMSVALALGALIGMVGIFLISSSHMGLYWNQDRPVFYGLVFVAFALFGIAATPYGAPAMSKGLINLTAIIIMLSMTLVIVRTVAGYPGLFQHLVRISACVTGVTAALGIFQSFVSNVLKAPELFNLTELSAVSGATWWWPAVEDGVVRAQSIYTEPSSLAAFIGFTTGLAYIRLGLFGKEKRDALRGIVPLWAAACIVLCMILTFSPVCYSAIMLTAIGTTLSTVKIRPRTIMILGLVTMMALGAGAAVVLLFGGEMIDRFASLIVFTQLAGKADLTTVTNGRVNFSTLTLFLNAVVAFRNVSAHPFFGAGMGAHPFAYSAYMPQLSAFGSVVMDNGHISATNKMDAASLFLRLMSETGVVGTLTFAVMCFSAMSRVRRTILDLLPQSGQAVELAAMSAGLNGAFLGLFGAFMFRIPQYYSMPFWTLFALCVAIPVLGGQFQARTPILHGRTD